MRKMILGVLGLLVIVLPQAAGAQDAEGQAFRSTVQYPAKFICGDAPAGQARLGIVEGHYNTIVNILASKNNTAIAFSATVVRTDLEITEGEPSEFSGRVDLDRDQAMGILCSDIKRGLFGASGEGLMDGFVTIYSSKPLTVTVVVTGENEGGHSMQINEVSMRRGGIRVRPSAEGPV